MLKGLAATADRSSGVRQLRDLQTLADDGAVLQGVFSVTAPAPQQKSRGFVNTGYVAATNRADLHIAAGSNDPAQLMKDFLSTLWEVRDTLVARAAAGGPAGHVDMHPAGSQVLKMTMEMLGEAVGANPALQNARTHKDARKQNAPPMGVGIPAGQANDILDLTVIPEHRQYRDSLVGAAGVTMAPIGPGTQGGTVDMLQANPAGAAERAAYDASLAALQPFMSIMVAIDLPVLNAVIASLEGKLTMLQRVALKASYAITG